MALTAIVPGLSFPPGSNQTPAHPLACVALRYLRSIPADNSKGSDARSRIGGACRLWARGLQPLSRAAARSFDLWGSRSQTNMHPAYLDIVGPISRRIIGVTRLDQEGEWDLHLGDGESAPAFRNPGVTLSWELSYAPIDSSAPPREAPAFALKDPTNVAPTSAPLRSNHHP